MPCEITLLTLQIRFATVRKPNQHLSDASLYYICTFNTAWGGPAGPDKSRTAASKDSQDIRFSYEHRVAYGSPAADEVPAPPIPAAAAAASRSGFFSRLLPPSIGASWNLVIARLMQQQHHATRKKKGLTSAQAPRDSCLISFRVLH